MKIGIVTQPLLNNYGGVLQNYALQTILHRLGHCPVTIDYIPPRKPLWKHFVSCIKNAIYFFLGKNSSLKLKQYTYQKIKREKFLKINHKIFQYLKPI